MCAFFAPASEFSVSLRTPGTKVDGGTKVILSGSLSAPLGSYPPLPADQADVYDHLVMCKMHRRRGLDLSSVFPYISVPC